MNYKHAYHAGNFADVVKHILLVQLLNQLGQKNKPFYVLDAYGSRGLTSKKARLKSLMLACVLRLLKPKRLNTMR